MNGYVCGGTDLDIVARISANRDCDGTWTRLRRLWIWTRINCVSGCGQTGLGRASGLVLCLLLLVFIVEKPKKRFLLRFVSWREIEDAKIRITIRTENGAVSNVSGLSSGVIEYMCLFISDGESGGESRALICSGRGQLQGTTRAGEG